MAQPGMTLHRYLPGYDVRTVAPLGEGLDNVAWLVNGEIVVRQERSPDPDAIRREVALLQTVSRYATLPVPQVIVADPEAGVLAYRHLPGQPLLDVPAINPESIAAELGIFLGALHRISLAELEGILPIEDESLHEWLEEAREMFAGIAGHIPLGSQNQVEAFLSSPLPPPPPQPPDPDHLVFCHNDFGAEHILVDPVTMRMTGIIDWSDAAIADPVRDLALILRDLGPNALDAALSAYGREVTSEDHRRLVFYARCKLIEDLAFGLETGTTRYSDAALAHLGYTFDDRTFGAAR